MKRDERSSYLLAALAIVLWSTVATAFKLGLCYFSPFELVFFASFTSAFVLGILSFYKHRSIVFEGIRSWRHISLTVVQALLNPYLYYIFLFGAYSRLPAQVAQPVNFTWPIFLSVFAILFMKEQFKARTFPALLLSFTGVIIVSLKGGAAEYTSINFNKGIIMGLLSAVIWAVYWIVNMKDSRPALVKLFWGFLVAFVFLFLHGWLTNQLPIIPEFTQVLAPIYIGLFEMSLTFFIWMTALEKAKNTPLLSNMVYLVPILSLGVIRMVLKEQIQINTYIGLALIISGVLFQAKRKK